MDIKHSALEEFDDRVYIKPRSLLEKIKRIPMNVWNQQDPQYEHSGICARCGNQMVQIHQFGPEKIQIMLYEPDKDPNKHAFWIEGYSEEYLYAFLVKIEGYLERKKELRNRRENRFQERKVKEEKEKGLHWTRKRLIDFLKS